MKGNAAGQVSGPIDYRMRFPALDGLRALAVTLVFAFHYGGGAQGGPLLRALNAVRLQGWAGVDLFFVLSGFLITGVLYDTSCARDSGYFRRFYARRSLRIFPVYYLVALVLLLITPILQLEWKPAHLLFLVYLGNLPASFVPALYQVQARTAAANVYLGHLWSLCVEEQFYLLWPLLVWLVRERIKLLWTAAALSLLALALRCWLVLFSGVDLQRGWLLDQLPFHMDALLLGAMLALLLRGEHGVRWQRGCVGLLAGSAALLAVLFARNPAGNESWMPTLGFSLLALASVGLIGWVLQPGTLGFRIFHLRPLRVLGRYSYGFYVYHLLFAKGWSLLGHSLGERLHSAALGSALALGLNFVVTFLVAKLSYDWFESRFLGWKQEFSYDTGG